MTSSELWVDKYRPKVLADIIGMDAQKQLFKDEVKAFLQHKSLKRAFLLVGPPGTGKTTMVECLATDMKAASHMVNASDSRSVEDVKRIFGASKTMSVRGRLKFIVLDEADALGKRAQRNISSYIEETLQPVFIICNDISKIKWDLQQKCLKINFTYPNKEMLAKFLKDILRKENESVKDDVLDTIVEKANSIRWAVAALQNYVQWGSMSESVEATPILLPKKDQVNLILAGNPRGYSGEPKELVFWMMDSAPLYGLIEQTDRIVNRRLKGDYRSARYAMQILLGATYPTKAVSRTPTLLAKAKVRFESAEKRRKKSIKANEKGEVSKRTDIKLTLSKTKTAESGSSLTDFF